MQTKIRLDQLLVKLSLASSREIAQSLIMRVDVLINDTPITKAGTKVLDSANIRIRGEVSRFVGRGGDKLFGALSAFAVDVHGKIAIDVGASTGGFTDCLLQSGAKLVYAVDVGYNQLAEKIRNDPRVIVMEKVNIKEVTNPDFPERPEIAVIDVSFIGLRKILQNVSNILTIDNASIIALVKPQFELGPEYVAKGGIVTDEKDRRLAVALVAKELQSLGFTVIGDTPSVLKGAKSGNQEYFIYARR